MVVLNCCCMQGTSRDSLSTRTFSSTGTTFQRVGCLAVESCAWTIGKQDNCYSALLRQVLCHSRFHQ